MTNGQLNTLKENAAEIVRQYTNGRVDAQLGGTEYSDTLNHCLRLHYLYGIIKEARLVGTDVYVGDTLLAGSAIEQVMHKIWHYNGIFAGVDLSEYAAVEVDSGDGGTTGGDTGSGIVDDHYRAGQVAVDAGSTVVSFSTPLSSADYQVDIRVVSNTGYEQRNVVPSAQYASGFVVDDILEAGTLHYTAILNL